MEKIRGDLGFKKSRTTLAIGGHRRMGEGGDANLCRIVVRTSHFQKREGGRS